MDRTMTRSNPTLTSTRPNSTSDHCPSSRLEPFFGDNDQMLQARTDLTSRIDAVDPEVGAAIRDEFERQQYTLELIPSESIASPAVLQALRSLLNNKYAEGYPGRHYYDARERQAKEVRPKMLLAGYSAYPRTLDFDRMAAIARGVDAYFFVDMAHFAGLVAGGAHPSPVPHADFVSFTTHKTMRGPWGAM